MKKGFINQKGQLFITYNSTIGSSIVNNETIQIKLFKYGGITGGAAKDASQRFARLSETTGRGNLTGQIMIKP
jgi:hypothetical protein